MGQFAHGGERGRPADREGRLRVAQEIFELGERVGGVERQQGRAGPQARERQHDDVGRLVDLRRHAVAGRPEASQERSPPAPNARTGRRRSWPSNRPFPAPFAEFARARDNEVEKVCGRLRPRASTLASASFPSGCFADVSARRTDTRSGLDHGQRSGAAARIVWTIVRLVKPSGRTVSRWDYAKQGFEGHGDDEKALRKSIVATAARLAQAGLGGASGGDISARFADAILITPSGAP